MPGRRAVLGGLAAGVLVAPSAGWADLPRARYLAASRRPDGTFALCGLDDEGQIAFQRPLPARGHAAAAHPQRAEAVAFARRPGRFALVLDCATGALRATLRAPAGRHFYGHGVFSADGGVLFTTENDYAAALGVVGLWDARTYARIGEFTSGGIGPHDIRLMPDGQTLVVANGGIETHPDSGRAKLNLPTMQSNLTYLGRDGTIHDQLVLPAALRLNSIRHLAVSAAGIVAFAMQWQGQVTAHPPLLGLHVSGQSPRLFDVPQDARRAMRGYAGSVAISGDTGQVAITGPRGGEAQIFDMATGQLLSRLSEPDICGVAGAAGGFLFTSGTGRVFGTGRASVRHRLQWDNHLVRIG